jgi:hypothetical protein
MSTYVRTESGVVQEIILPLLNDDGVEWPIEERFTPEFVGSLVDVTTVIPQPAAGWNYDGSTFSAPVVPIASADEVLDSNTTSRDALLSLASTAIAPLQMAVSLGEATEAETALAKGWVAYSRAVKAVDLRQSNPTWPTAPDS